MSTSPDSHGENGREILTVHDHDVLSGRGVNIAQHPGNERFRALVTTRYDDAYCSTFTTNEKRALAREIIDHIQNLDPPGRFLKRNGKSHSNRGLMGPWEELSPKEVLKKTCQALRDCNRNDRSGYAAAVAVPQDVIENAEQRSRSGLTLKQYAEAVVARSKPFATKFKDRSFEKYVKKPADRPKTASRKKNSPTRDDAARSSSSIDEEWLKRPNDVESLSQRGVANHSPHGTDMGSYMGGPGRVLQPPSGMSSIPIYHHATPTGQPLMASVPVTNTPLQPHSMYHHPYSEHPTVPASLRHPPPIPPHTPVMYYHGHVQPASGQHRTSGGEDVHARIVSLPAPYSPVVWNRRKESEEIDDSAEPVPMAAWKDDHDGHGLQNEDDFRSAAEAAALIDNEADRNDFDLLSGEDLPHDDGSLNIDELE
ncbi:hypothetical protein IV203_027403 [Nitzschia inconspicua]|uniref:DUF6824 domain-containing protein n=1 Tax=Nitzschia inconspicua TaxID=303405 RepID=A0A9K3Q3C1_9STRA|nr:hypothetical protein IV203_027403 [Nitzschia inconspicua]